MLKGGAIALASAVLVASVAAACTSIAHGSIDHQPQFTITNTISSSATQQTPALLYPGVPRYLWYTAHNPLNVPITVRTMSISSVTPPTGCPTVNLNYASTTFSGSLVVPAVGSNSRRCRFRSSKRIRTRIRVNTRSFSSRSRVRRPLAPLLQPRPYVSSSHDPSVIGQSVTYTATVISGDGSGNQPNSGNPTGTVTFFDGSTVICSNVPVSTGLDGTSAGHVHAPDLSRSPASIRSLRSSPIPTGTSLIRRPRYSIKSSNPTARPPRF